MSCVLSFFVLSFMYMFSFFGFMWVVLSLLIRREVESVLCMRMWRGIVLFEDEFGELYIISHFLWIGDIVLCI